MILHHRGCPIRKSAGHGIFPPYRSLSQVITSFIGSQCQGIHLMLFFAWTAVFAFSPFFWNETFEFSFFAWASQIIVLGCKLKDLCSLIHVSCPPRISQSETDEIVPTSFVRKNLKKLFSNKFFSKSTFFQVNYIQLSVSFLSSYSVFNEHLPLG